MKNERITVSFPFEKLQAIQIHSPEAYDNIEHYLEEALDKIYQKYVPVSTRKYIEAVTKIETDNSSKGGKK